MELVYEYTQRVQLERRIVGPGPYGTRVVASATGGTIRGQRLNGKVVGAGADWLLIGADGYARLDVRAQFETDDGAVIYVSYGGLIERTERFQAASQSSGETRFEDQYFRITPRLEAGDERYQWVNQTLFAGRGRSVSDGVEFEVFRIT
ncbi:MAG: DUF3237 domain-containing protein [Burkholderiaceae bacterium]